MAATANVAPRLLLTGAIVRIDARDQAESADGRFKARRAVSAIVFTDGGGFAQVAFPENWAAWAESSLGAGERVCWLVDLAEGRGDNGAWSRLSFVTAVEDQKATKAS